jgi:hypothetical protein
MEQTGGAMRGVGTNEPVTLGGVTMIVCAEGEGPVRVTSVETSPNSGIDVTNFAVINHWPDEVEIGPGKLADADIDLENREVTQRCQQKDDDAEYSAVAVELRRVIPDEAVSKYFLVHWTNGHNSGSIQFDSEQWICASESSCGPQ